MSRYTTHIQYGNMLLKRAQELQVLVDRIRVDYPDQTPRAERLQLLADTLATEARALWGRS